MLLCYFNSIKVRLEQRIFAGKAAQANYFNSIKVRLELTQKSFSLSRT